MYLLLYVLSFNQIEATNKKYTYMFTYLPLYLPLLLLFLHEDLSFCLVSS